MKKRAIVITSMGPLDVAAITLMGLSTKRGDTEKIGMFGTGLKYSLAKLLRDRVPFRIWNGDHELKIETNAGNFRGTNYEQVVVDGQHTSITTDMGPQWETWWVVRELLSNARDEAVHEFYVCDWDAVEFRPEWTTFVLDYEAFEQVWLAREKYFVTDRQPRFEGKRLRAFTRWANEGTRIYKNGVLVHESPRPDAYDYDVLDCELNEMREPRYAAGIGSSVTAAIMSEVDDEAVLNAWIASMNSIHRANVEPFSGDTGFFYSELSPAWKKIAKETDAPFMSKEALGGDGNTHGIILPEDVVGLLHKEQDRERAFELSSPTPEQDRALRSAILSLFDNRFHVTAPVKVCTFGKGVIARVMEGNIVLAPNVFADPAMLVETLLEEQLHIDTGQRDCTREFQNSIFRRWAACILDRTEPARPTEFSGFL